MDHNIDQQKNLCAYKLDLSKAYDMVDWGFLKEVMQRIGFAHQWIEWIMPCVTTVKYVVKLNGGLLDSFSPSRGLRQGDPLSPFCSCLWQMVYQHSFKMRCRIMLLPQSW